MKHNTLSKTINTIVISTLILLQVACKKETADPNPVPGNAVSAKTDTYIGSLITDWNDLQIKLIMNTPGYVSPVAARSMAYISLATYETVVQGMPEHQSMVGKIEGLSQLPKADSTKEYHWALAANAAHFSIMRELYASSGDVFKARMDTLRKNNETKLKVGIDQDVIERSIRFGAEVATAVWEFSKTDGGHLAYMNNFPTNIKLKTGAGAWKPTGAQKIPLLPTWGDTRSFLKSTELSNTKPIGFSFEQNSAFFEQANQVYLTSKNLSTEQKAIADYWTDENELMGATGHLLLVANNLFIKENLDLAEAALYNLQLGMALNDALIGAMKNKYTYNYMRPLTYIKQTINPGWTSSYTIQPSPDYTSNLATAAAAMAEVMRQNFGDEYPFEDNVPGKSSKRTYKTFTDFAAEAAISQFYQGIHYRMSVDDGLLNGTNVAKKAIALIAEKK